MFTLAIPYAGSLKAKRSVVNSVKGRVTHRFNVSIAEVGDSERWQRADLALTVVGNEASHLEEVIDAVRRLVLSSTSSAGEVEVIDFRSRVVPWEWSESR